MEKFNENSVVCFLGDSITHAGFWLRRVYEYNRKIGINCEMYNCGVSGDNSGNGLGRLDETLFIYNPTDVVIDFGMNDINYMLYDGRAVTDEVIKERRCAIDNCLTNIKKLINVFTERGIRIILCSPTPYDEISESETFCNEGAQAALKTVSDYLRNYATEQNIDFVDFNTEMHKVMKKLGKEGKKLHSDDRIHPSEEGHEVMAQIFLKAMGYDVEIIDDYSKLCEITSFKYDEWEDKRYKLEQLAKSADFVVWCLFYGEKDKAVVDAGAKRFINDEPGSYVAACCTDYLEKYDEILQAQKDLVTYTKSAKENTL